MYHTWKSECVVQPGISLWYQTSWEIYTERGHSGMFILLLHRDFYSVNANFDEL